MPFLQLTLHCTNPQQSAIEAILQDLGALSVTLLDAQAEEPDEEAIFEPGVGEMPLWGTLRMQALFASDTDQSKLRAVLANRKYGVFPESVEFAKIADQDWTRVWMDRFRPMPFGHRLWVYPWHVEPPEDPDLAVIRLDPGLAFGTGTHPTTALCLEWLDGLDLHETPVLDYGCGSGILALAALQLGAPWAVGVDTDPQALTAATNNAAHNELSDQLSLYAPQQLPDTRYPLLVANILAGPLLQLAPRFAELTEPGAAFAISGLLLEQADTVKAGFVEAGFEHLQCYNRDGWLRISGYRQAE